MAIKKDTETTIIEVKDAVALAKKENTEEAKKDVREKAHKAVMSAVSHYIEELKKEEGSLANIGRKLNAIDTQIQTKEREDPSTVHPILEKSLWNWLNEDAEPSLSNLCLLEQVHHVSYDYILGLDKKISANQLSYGYTLDFFFYLFRAKKIKVFRGRRDGLFEPATTVASKGYFDMTRYIIFTDRTLCDIFKELNHQKVADSHERNKDEGKSRYKRALQQSILEYENIPLVSEACGTDTKRHKPLLPDNRKNKPSQEEYHGLPDDLKERLKSLPEKYAKTQKQFCEDTYIPTSTFSDWIKKDGAKVPEPSRLYLMAVTHNFSLDWLLQTGTSDGNMQKHSDKYTYGNTLRFIDHLQTAGIIFSVPNLEYVAPSANSMHRRTKKTGGENPNNMNYSCDGEMGYYTGLFFIRDDFLIRLITEMESEMSRPFDAPQSPDIAQIGYEMSQAGVDRLIARYDRESLLCYQGKAGKALMDRSEGWHKYCYGHNDPWTSLLDMSLDLDEMLQELRAVETNASKAL